MRSWANAVLFCVAVTPVAAQAAVHPTKAQQAYFDEHDKCVKELREDEKAAGSRPAAQQKAILAAAKSEYGQCEAWAHLIWKYYPRRPPGNAPKPSHASGSGATVGKPRTVPPSGGE